MPPLRQPSTAPEGTATAHPRFGRRRGALLVAVVLAAAGTTAGAVVLPASSASATIRQRIASAEQQLTALQNQAQRISDQYDAARIQLAAAQQRASQAQAQVAAAQLRVQALQRHVSSFAVSAYQGDNEGALTALTSSSPASFLTEVTSLDAVSRGQRVLFDQLTVAERSRREAQLTAGRALRTQRVLTATLQQEKTAIEASATRQEALLRRLRAEQARLIAEARARAAAARRAAARAAALRAARAAAARQAALAREQQATQQAAQTFASGTGSSPPVAGSGGAKVAVEWAYRELGKPYVWAAAGPNAFDCSGLTQYVWGKAGVYLPHYTVSQWDSGTRVSRANLAPGDLVFFPGSDGTWSAPGHVGIYVGNGNMIDAPYTGTVVQVQAIPWSQYIGAVNPE
jgi:cell wall-associated NlpC family hydrolase